MTLGSGPSSVSTINQDEWEMRKILMYMGLMTDTMQGRLSIAKTIVEFQQEMNY